MEAPTPTIQKTSTVEMQRGLTTCCQCQDLLVRWTFLAEDGAYSRKSLQPNCDHWSLSPVAGRNYVVDWAVALASATRGEVAEATQPRL